jgi:sigma-B regulation protein RsbU (phosphoserine phosphatase)
MEGSLVGGDFYDVWSVGDGWMMIIGDVTGKGVEAAALTALVRHTMRTASEFLSSPAELLGQVDRTLKHRRALSVCTALCVLVRDDRATLAVGGHPLPLYVTGRAVTTLGDHGPLLGAFTEAAWDDVTVELEAGSTLVAYTDGITDAVDDERRRFGLERLCEALRGLANRPAAEVVECLTGVLADFQTGAHADDTAAIVLHRLSPSDATAEPAASVESGRGAVRLVGARHGQTH